MSVIKVIIERDCVGRFTLRDRHYGSEMNDAIDVNHEFIDRYNRVIGEHVKLQQELQILFRETRKKNKKYETKKD